MIRSLKETWSALKTWPDGKQWCAAIKITIPALLIFAALGLLAGWAHWKPIEDWPSALKISILLFFVPAFFEEILFRGLLLSWLAARWTRWAAWISTILFVLWYPLQAAIIGPPLSAIFLDSAFLIGILILGVILAHVRIVSRSLWPVILIHWIAVLIWKLLLGGPF